ncbi:MAG: YicC/YloC family endoribonuclease [Verrucomicrobiota bacterium]
MTGYGRVTANFSGSTLTVQVSSVNRKMFDLTVSLPEEWESLEPAIGELVRKFAARGKIHVDIELMGDAGAEESWNEDAAAAALDRLAAFAAREGVAFVPSAELLWQIASSQRRGGSRPAAEEARAAVTAVLEDALRAFAAMRATEGEALLVDFLARCEGLRRHVEVVATRAPLVPPAQREQLLKRLREAGLELDPADERVLREIALFADRCDVTEELTRLRSHLDQFAVLLKSDGEIGRKAEFILQEIGREVNTIGSKGNDLTIARAVIELKNELERVREQIANIE